MSDQELQVQKEAKDIKEAAKDETIVDNFIKALKDAQKTKGTYEIDKSLDKSLSQKDVAAEQEKNLRTQKTIEAFLQSTQSKDIITSIKDKFIEKITDIGWKDDAPKFETFIEAKKAFEEDIKLFRTQIDGLPSDIKDKIVNTDWNVTASGGQKRSDQVNTKLGELPPLLNEMQPYIDLHLIRKDENHARELSKEQLSKYVDATKTPAAINATYKEKVEALDKNFLEDANKWKVTNRILDARKAINQKEKWNTDKLRNLPANKENAIYVFETCNPKDFDELIYQIAGKNVDKTEITETTQPNFVDQLKQYADNQNLSDIYVGTASNLGHGEFPDRTKMIQFNTNTTLENNKTTTIKWIEFTLDDKWVLTTIKKWDETYTYNKTDNKVTDTKNKTSDRKDIFWDKMSITEVNGKWIVKTEKIVVRWTQDHMQALRAEKATIPTPTREANKPENGINQFDDIWNYQAFKKYLENTDGTGKKELSEHMLEITTQILNYKPAPGTADAWEDLNGLKNGYCNILSDFIVANKSDTNLVQSYLNQVKANNELLGRDTETIRINVNKLQAANINVASVLSATLIKDIYNQNPQNVLEQGKNMLKEGMKLLLDLLTSLGLVSKSTLKDRWLGNAFDEAVNSYFKEKYELSVSQMKKIEGISWDDGTGTFTQTKYIESLTTAVIADPKLLDLKVAEQLLAKAGKEKTEYIKYSKDNAEIISWKVKDLIEAMLLNEDNRKEIQDNTNKRYKDAKWDIDAETALKNWDQREIDAFDVTLQSKITSIYLTDLGVKKDMSFVIEENFNKPKTVNVQTQTIDRSKEQFAADDNVIATDDLNMRALVGNNINTTNKITTIPKDATFNVVDPKLITATVDGITRHYIKVKYNNQEWYVAQELLTKKTA